MKFIAAQTKTTINSLVKFYNANLEWRHITGGNGTKDTLSGLMDFDALTDPRQVIANKKKK